MKARRNRASLPSDYAERVYAGVLGKLIGVYLGRPFEGWTQARIERELGEIRGYVNDRLEPKYRTPLVVTDDDIAGTFVFPRALADHGYPRRLTAKQIGQTWLNYIVEGRSVLWWGGFGTSTEHTAYLRLKQGIPAPRSGSAALNGQLIAEQIGAQIFIDGWALASPGDPELAADLAEQAARVSHDGVAVHAARLLAAMEAQAFTEPDIDRLLDVGLASLPGDSLIRRMVGEVRDWHAQDTAGDWRSTRARIAARYGYDRYGGGCHVVPNHALIVLGLLYGGGHFQDPLSIVCTAGWDTDCNAGNLGCLLGIRGGLAAIDAGPDWRGPVADRMYLSSAEGGGAISDAVIEAQAMVRAGHALAGLKPPEPPKRGARFSFAFPGSVQGFRGTPGLQPLEVDNAEGHSRDGRRSLALRVRGLAAGQVARAATPTYFGPEVFGMRTYALMCCPTLYSGQCVELRLEADAANSGPLTARVFCSCFGAKDRLEPILGPACRLDPAGEAVLTWCVPDTAGRPVAELGVELAATDGAVDGTVYVDYVRWTGAPDTMLRRPDEPGEMWLHAWVNAASHFGSRPEAFRISQDRGLGLVIQGTREWQDYTVASTLTPHLAKSWGLAVRVGGLRRYYAAMFEADDAGTRGERVRLVKMRDALIVLAEQRFAWQAGQAYAVQLRVHGNHIALSVDGHLLLEKQDAAPDRLTGGGVALLCEEGALSTDAVAIRP